jgi:hypothetical protein
MTGFAMTVLWFVWSPEVEAQTFPPESVCETCYRAAEARYYDAKARYEFGGSWPLRQQMDAAKREADIVFAAWWVQWTKSSPEDRRHWIRRYRELIQGE